jgi:uncharacterized protein involved in exopolysaccharide biosynthesis
MIIDNFDLYSVYELSPEVKNYKQIALKTLASSISAYENEFNAYEITVRANSPKLSADITNYIVRTLNEKLIELRTQKSKNNRIFLKDRVTEIRESLKNSEDSLMIYQEKSGMLEPVEQFKGIVNAYTTLETELITRQIERSILIQLRGENSPQVNNITLEVEEYERKIREIKNTGSPEGMIPALDVLPEKGINYFRLLREVEINSKILEFVLPLYEQAKIEEKKDIPTLQVIDYAIPPEKKSFPPRTIITLVITFGVFIITLFFILIRENQNWQQSEKFLFIRKNLFRWKNTG